MHAQSSARPALNFSGEKCQNGNPVSHGCARRGWLAFPLAADGWLSRWPRMAGFPAGRGWLAFPLAAVVDGLLGFKDRPIGIRGVGKLANALIPLYLLLGAKVMISRCKIDELEKF